MIFEDVIAAVLGNRVNDSDGHFSFCGACNLLCIVNWSYTLCDCDV